MSDAEPATIAAGVMAALAGGLLLARTARSPRPLEIALDMAIEQTRRTLSAGNDAPLETPKLVTNHRP
ncbi:hypothetical protein ACQPZQ_16405 [Pseudonocardia sp. CA-142604]|uniref:hypothetical protein n=1 Tax=Pseudonocardia sp. CA-142604 TaxID=3240024 RepID=UPI003D9454A8